MGSAVPFYPVPAVQNSDSDILKKKKQIGDLLLLILRSWQKISLSKKRLKIS